MATSFTELEKNLWSAADNLRANSDLKSQEYSTPVLGLIFLKYADNRFTKAKDEIGYKQDSRISIGPEDFISKKGWRYKKSKRRCKGCDSWEDGLLK